MSTPITVGPITLSSPDLVIPGVITPLDNVQIFNFLDGGGAAVQGRSVGQIMTMVATLDTVGDSHELRGAYTWADMVALLALPNTPQVIGHPKIEECGQTGMTAIFDKNSLKDLIQYDFGRGEFVNPTITATYPNTSFLLRYYGVLNFLRMS